MCSIVGLDIRQKRKIYVPIGIRTVVHPALSPVTIVTKLYTSTVYLRFI